MGKIKTKHNEDLLRRVSSCVDWSDGECKRLELYREQSYTSTPEWSVIMISIFLNAPLSYFGKLWGNGLQTGPEVEDPTIFHQFKHKYLVLNALRNSCCLDTIPFHIPHQLRVELHWK